MCVDICDRFYISALHNLVATVNKKWNKTTAAAVAATMAAVTTKKICFILFQFSAEHGKIGYIRLHICTEQLRR